MSEANHQHSTLDAVQREAVAWVQRLDSGQTTSDEAVALQRWCAQSAAHASAFVEARQAWTEITSAGRDLRRRGGEMAMPLEQFRTKPVGRRALLVGGLAAASAAAAYMVVKPPLALWPSLNEMRADYRTGTGEQRNIMLAHDVSVQLNTQTSLVTKASSEDADRIELISGEASFTTAPSMQRPLVVLAQDGSATASGSRFDIRATVDESGPTVCVTCYQGAVRVEQRSASVALAPGQQVRYGAAGIGQVGVVDPEVVSAWQRGIVVFHAVPLAEVVREINRYRPGEIILLNATLGREQVSGRFRIDQMDEILLRLQQGFSAKARMLPGGIVLLS